MLSGDDVTGRQQWRVVGIAALGVAVGVISAQLVLGREFALVTVGSHAPDFRATTIEPNAVAKTLADYRGDVVVLNVWATWCVPCRVEMPSMEALHRTYAPRGLKVVAVSIDDADADAVIRGFVREYGLTFEILHDRSGAIEHTYQTTGVPETFVIGRDGVIRKKVIGAEDWGSPGNQALIAQLLAEPSDRHARGQGE